MGLSKIPLKRAKSGEDFRQANLVPEDSYLQEYNEQIPAFGRKSVKATSNNTVSQTRFQLWKGRGTCILAYVHLGCGVI